MAWNFRRSVNFGPFRMDLSRSGVGYSVGVRGFRVGKDSKGRRYRSLSIPNTGIYRRDYEPIQRLPTVAGNPNTGSSATQSPTISRQSKSWSPWAIYIGGAVIVYVLLRLIFAFR
jgi:hypothetical protein